MRRWRAARAAAALVWLAACAAPGPSVRKTQPAPAVQEKPIEARSAGADEDLPRELPGQAAIFYVVHPAGRPEAILDVVHGHPNFRATFIFPAKYFDAPDRAESLERFRVLQSSRQIEVALTLENEPILPLLGSLRLAGDKTARWGFDYQWPEDISAQIARGSGAYQRRWKQMPGGFSPPYFALSEQVVTAARRFRLPWVIAKPSENWGRRDYAPTVLIVPPPTPLGADEAGSFGWAEKLAAWALSRPVALINGSEWSDPAHEAIFLDRLASRAAADENARLVTGRELAQAAIDIPPIAENAEPFRFDYSPWVQSNRQRLAWMALAQARSVIRPYRNSGHANLQMLDAAYEELHQAQSGPFLLALGQAEVPLTINERNFLATLSNVYRLSGASVPPQLSRWFSDRGAQRAAKSLSDPDRPFFVESLQQLVWNDPLGDDNGPGKYVYPLGRYEKGTFDLSQFSIQWNNDEIHFAVDFAGYSPSRAASLVPAAQIYIDINRLTDAGSTSPLRARNGTTISREAAWEYVLSISPTAATLYQAVPGGAPRKIRTMKSADKSSFRATLARQDVRGDPRQWRFTVAAVGIESGKDDGAPAPVMTAAGEKNFGGAVSGRDAPPFIDILASTPEEQAQRLDYTSGAKVTLNYVGAQ